MDKAHLVDGANMVANNFMRFGKITDKCSPLLNCSEQVQHILVAGHYNCGCMKASLLWKNATPGIVNLWISDVRSVRDQHAGELQKLSGDAQVNRYQAVCSMLLQVVPPGLG